MGELLRVFSLSLDIQATYRSNRRLQRLRRRRIRNNQVGNELTEVAARLPRPLSPRNMNKQPSYCDSGAEHETSAQDGTNPECRPPELRLK